MKDEYDYHYDEVPRLGNVIDLVQGHVSKEINLLWCLQDHSRCDHMLLEPCI